MAKEIFIEQVDQSGRVAPAPPRFDGRDAALLLGAFLVLLGLWLIYPPAALIAGGVLCLLYALQGARGSKRKHGNPHS